MNLQTIQNRIIEIRGYKVILDFDLATLYEVENRTLKQAVRRNRDRFPADFMFELTEEEVDLLVSHFVIPSKSYFGEHCLLHLQNRESLCYPVFCEVKQQYR